MEIMKFALSTAVCRTSTLSSYFPPSISSKFRPGEFQSLLRPVVCSVPSVVWNTEAPRPYQSSFPAPKLD